MGNYRHMNITRLFLFNAICTPSLGHLYIHVKRLDWMMVNGSNDASWYKEVVLSLLKLRKILYDRKNRQHQHKH